MKESVLRIGLDSRPLESGFKSHLGRGTGRYTEELTSRLLKHQPNAEFPFEFSALSEKNFGGSTWRDAVVKSLPAGKRTFESQVAYPNRIATMGVDAVHFFAHGDAPARALVPQVVSVLDLIPLKFPELYKASKSNLRFRFARFLEYRAIQAADVLVAISEATKRDVVDILSVDPEKIVVTPLAASAHFSNAPLHSEEEVRQILALPKAEPLLLYVGGIDPRKNIPFLLGVFADILKERVAKGLAKPRLLLAGKIQKDDQYPRLKAEIERLGVAEQVTELGFVADELLPDLYRAVSAFVYPSLYEGFGLPVLEAMSAGCPVVAANNSSLPEVAGDAAILLPDMAKDVWVEAILALLDDSSRQLSMIKAGAERAALFSWGQTCEKTMKAYQMLSELRLGKAAN